MKAALGTPAHVEDVLLALSGVKPRGKGWSALCPAHDDSDPSLDIDVAPDGRLLLVCRAGCTNDAVMQSAGIEARDLFPTDSAASAREGFGKIEATYDYTDEAGALLYQVVRFETPPGAKKDVRQRRPDPQKPGRWIWKLGDVRRPLFRLPRVLKAIREGRRVMLVEGEKDVLSMEHHGFVATTHSGGASLGNWTEGHSRLLAGAHVTMLPDYDDAGWRHAYDPERGVLQSLARRAASVRVLHLPDLAEKGDVTDWLEAGGTPDDLKQLIRGLAPWDGKVRVWPDLTPATTTGVAVTRTTATGVTLTTAEDHEDALRPEDLAASQVAAAKALTERDLSDAPRWAFRDLDAMLGKMMPTHLMVVGAMSGNGKSTLLMSQAQAFAAEDVQVLYVPLEVEPEVCRIQWACTRLDLSFAPVLRHDWHLLPEGAREAVNLALDEQEAVPGVHFATPKRMDMAQLRHWCEWGVREFGCRVVMLDHFHRLTFGRSGGDFRIAATEGARELKDLARDLNVVMVVGAQLNRTNDPLDPYIAPTPARLKETAALHEEADVVVMLSRGLNRSLPDKWMQRLRLGSLTEKDIAEPHAMIATCRKHRQDDTARDRRVKLHVSGGRVRNAAPAYRDAEAEEHEPWYQR